MNLTPKNKKTIDDKDYTSLLRGWRFANPGDPWFQGATGVYWGNRMKKLRKDGVDHVAASKEVGVDGG